MRKGAIKRTTKETDVEVAIDLDGTGASTIATAARKARAKPLKQDSAI